MNDVQKEPMCYRIYCDESCHLPHDDSSLMVQGAVYCPEGSKERIFQEIREIKEKHGLSSFLEIKWTKVSLSQMSFFLDLVDYFKKNRELCYRGIVAMGKEQLDHDRYNQGSHDLWYYKMYYLMLSQIIQPAHSYKIYIDIKDTHGVDRVKKLRDVLCNNVYDYKKDVVKSITQVNSLESEILQLADLINGAVGYLNRGLVREGCNEGKRKIVEDLSKTYRLDRTSALGEHKFNLFFWHPRKEGCVDVRR